METDRIALVAVDPDDRIALAAAFDGAPSNWEVTLHDSDPGSAEIIVDATGEIPGAIPFRGDPDGVVEEVTARLSETQERVGGSVYVVTSGSGGAGATTIALHLSAALSHHGPTCYLELARRSGAAARLGLEDGRHKTWADAGTCADDLRLAALPMAGGFRSLLSPRDAPDPPPDLIRRAERSFRSVVVDVAPERLGDVVTGAAAGVLVLRPSVPGVVDAALVLDGAPDLPWAVVAVRTGPGGGMTRAEAARRLGRPVPLEFPCTPALRDAEDEARLVTDPWRRFVRRIDTLARSLTHS